MTAHAIKRIVGTSRFFGDKTPQFAFRAIDCASSRVAKRAEIWRKRGARGGAALFAFAGESEHVRYALIHLEQLFFRELLEGF